MLVILDQEDVQVFKIVALQSMLPTECNYLHTRFLYIDKYNLSSNKGQSLSND